MAGPHQPERAATTDLPNQINNVCMYVCMPCYSLRLWPGRNISCLKLLKSKRQSYKISDLRSELTKSTNNFINFKSDIQFRVNEMDKAVNFFCNKYDKVKKLIDILKKE